MYGTHLFPQHTLTLSSAQTGPADKLETKHLYLYIIIFILYTLSCFILYVYIYFRNLNFNFYQ